MKTQIQMVPTLDVTELFVYVVFEFSILFVPIQWPILTWLETPSAILLDIANIFADVA